MEMIDDDFRVAVISHDDKFHAVGEARGAEINSGSWHAVSINSASARLESFINQPRVATQLRHSVQAGEGV